MHKSQTSLSEIIASIIIIIAGIVFAKSVILPFILSVFISVICMQPISWLEKRKVPYSLAIFIVLLAVVSVLLLLGGDLGQLHNQLHERGP